MQPQSAVANGNHHHNAASRVADTLRSEICSNRELSFLMEAHDGLSRPSPSRRVSKALASGLSISSSLGYRDANEASWTELVDVVERMADASDLPILVDGDSGFGNFNNARLLARKLAQRGAAGVALEDKGFPKMNSFAGDRHPLADVGEFSGRLRAVKDTVGDQLVLVARIEALIAATGWTRRSRAPMPTRRPARTPSSFIRARALLTRFCPSRRSGKTGFVVIVRPSTIEPRSPPIARPAYRP